MNTPFYGGAYYYYTNYTAYTTNAPWNFQTVGAGGHYLPPYSPYHGLGTTNVPWRVTAALQGATTWAPVTVASNSVYSGTNLVFSPQIPRDGWGASYDLGYHYPALDFLLLGPVLCTDTRSYSRTAYVWAHGVRCRAAGASSRRTRRQHTGK